MRLRKLALTSVLATMVVAGLSAALGQSTASVIKIGAIYPMTGSLASYGVNDRKALLFAQDLINGSYNLQFPLAKTIGLPNLHNAKIQLIFADDQGQPNIGRSAAQRLITQDHVVALTGCYQSSVTQTASAVAEKLQIPFLNGDSSAPSLTQRGFKYFFRSTPLESDIAKNAIQFAIEAAKQHNDQIETVALIHENTEYGTESSQYLKQFATQDGLKVVADIAYKHSGTDFTSEVLQAKRSKPDVVFLSSYVQDAILLTKTFKQLDYMPKAIIGVSGTNVPGYIQGLGKDANDIITYTNFPLDVGQNKPILKEIDALFTKYSGHGFDDASARAFTGLIVLADAINQAGSTNPQAIDQALENLNLTANDVIMPWGGIKFDPTTHQNELVGVAIQQIQGGTYHTVWPFNIASAKLVWPLPGWSNR